MNVISVSLFAWLITNNQTELITDNTRYQARETISSLVRGIGRLGNHSPSSRDTLIHKVCATLNDQRLSFLIFHGQQIDSASKGMSLPADASRNALAAQTLHEESGLDYHMTLDDSHEQMRFYIPLANLGLEDTFLLVSLSLHEVGRRFRDLNQLLVVTLLLLTLLHAAFAFVVIRMVVSPLHRLDDATRYVASGDYGHRVNLDRVDEIGALADSFNSMTGTIQENFQRMGQMAVTDELTQLYNRRHFFEQLDLWMARSHRHHSPLSLILLDIDHFKKVNDTWGHLAGDQVLRQVAACLSKQARKTDLVARYGGEEMVMLLPDTDLTGAVTFAEKVRKALEATNIPWGNGDGLH
ncbi:MAG TPA: GGDEF domain-containing protein, partial [Fibrobacteraceae bacterium]|nr:GGDEF domain-containing protein [Fibrobacteraceae bacterium]